MSFSPAIFVTLLGVMLLTLVTVVVQAQQDISLTGEDRTRVIEAVIKRLNESYVLPETAAQMEQRKKLRKTFVETS